MTIKLDRRFLKQAKGVFEKYEFVVGVIEDKPHRSPLPASKGLKAYAGGPARKLSRKSYQMVSQVSEKLRKNTGINFYTNPFKSKNNSDILKFTKSFFKLCTGTGTQRRTENLLQAIVRNPILRGDYGSNSRATVKIKGFNRFMIDTSQLFQSIKAKVMVRSVSK